MQPHTPFPEAVPLAGPSPSAAQLAALASQYPYALVLHTAPAAQDEYGIWQSLAMYGTAAAPLVTSWPQLLALPWPGGRWWAGGLPYSGAPALEPTLPAGKPAPISWPEVAWFGPQLVLGLPRGGGTWQVLTDEEGRCAAGFPKTKPLSTALPEMARSAWMANMTRDEYLQLVDQTRAQIRQGTFYELNLARTLSAPLPVGLEAAALFVRLAQRGGVPFAGLFRWQGNWAVSASPERFLQLHQGRLLTQPIKGTSPRGSTLEQDAALASALANSIKNRAENVMITDLARNDLHRSSVPGSVQVPHLFKVESYPTVHQLVSSITGTLAPDVPGWQALAAAFPPGSMTGAPKLKTMEWIDRLEPHGRGLYAGSLGWASPHGSYDWSVVIRTLLLCEQQGLMTYATGGAITWLSDAVDEFEETMVKTEALNRLFSVD